MSQARYFSSTAIPTTLYAAITSSATSVAVPLITGLPTSYPYTVVVDWGVFTGSTLTQEAILITQAPTGTGPYTFSNVTRGYDGTTAQAHAAGASFVHSFVGKDGNDFQIHESDSTGVHGVTGTVMDTADNLSNLASLPISRTNLGFGPAAMSVTTNATATGTVNLDPTVSKVFNLTQTGNVTLTFNPGTALVSGTLYTFTLYLYQNATGGWTTTFPGSVTWLGGTAPVLATTASALNLFVFQTFNAGTTWNGAMVQAATSASAGAFLTSPVEYAPSDGLTYTVSTTGMAALDTTNLTITFTAPASGKVLVQLSAYVSDASGGSNVWFGLINASGGAVIGPTWQVVGSSQANKSLSVTSPHLVTGLTAGTSYTFRFAAACDAATTQVSVGANGGSTSALPAAGGAPAMMTVQAVLWPVLPRPSLTAPAVPTRTLTSPGVLGAGTLTRRSA